MRRVLLTRQAVVVAATAVGALGMSAPAIASSATQPAAAPSPATHAPHRAVFAHSLARPKLPAGERYTCQAPTQPGQMTCRSIIRTAAGFGFKAAAAVPLGNGFYVPSDLRKAYKITTAATKGGHGKTIAIVDAFSDPKAAADLSVYRSRYHLPKCTTSNGCLRILNEHGRTSPLPKANASWAVEESLDLDMVSAICPNCHILLVEASSASTADLGTAVNTGVAKGAKYVSNSWSGGEFIGQDFFNHFFNHPGVVVDFASGDFGYGPAYPTDTQFVTAIGGTTLKHASGGRGWSESAWGSAAIPDGTGSGCSTLAAKSSWQRADATEPAGCLNRTENDVSAVANPSTGVAVYDTYKQHGLFEVGGTSAATPIITGIYALAGTPTKGTYPAQYPYLHASHLFDVTSGVNGRCESVRKYLCHGVGGYDGPTGLGTPNGTGAFTDGSAHRVTLVDPGTQDASVSASFSLTITGLDTGSVSSLAYSATGLPGGLSINAVPSSTNGRITGTLPATAGTFNVAVTAKDGAVAGTTHFTIVVVPSLTGTSTSSTISLTSNPSLCLDDNGGGVSTLVKIQSCSGSATQNWTYQSGGGPNDIGKVAIAGLCLGLSGSNAVLASCTGSLAQRWEYLGFGLLGNLSTGTCLAAASMAAGAQALVANCTGNSKQTWDLPLGQVISGVSSLCLDNPGDSSFSGTQSQVVTCSGASELNWQLLGDGLIASDSGLCLSGNGSLLSGTAIIVTVCNDLDFSQLWIPGPGGELINANSGRCLADPGNGGTGTGLTQQDCYGKAGEVWGLN